MMWPWSKCQLSFLPLVLASLQKDMHSLCTYTHVAHTHTQTHACANLILIAAGVHSLMPNKPSACVSVPAGGVALGHGQ